MARLAVAHVSFADHVLQFHTFAEKLSQVDVDVFRQLTDKASRKDNVTATYFRTALLRCVRCVAERSAVHGTAVQLARPGPDGVL